MPVEASFSFPTSIDVGPGVLRKLPEHVRRLGSSAFIVTEKGVAALPLFSDICAVLTDAGIPWEMTDRISPNPYASECEAGGGDFRASGCDVIIGVGGGSALDGAKGIALMATHRDPMVSYDDALGGDERIDDTVPPIICIPTTAGTGSEVGRSTVVIDEETHRKVVVFSPYLLPKVALLDPELMVGLPPHLTAATGFDALTHNLEALVAKGYHPLCDALAMEGLALCHQFLERAVRTPDDLEARQGMAVASLMGATAFQKGLGAAHSLAHPLSSLAGMHHGLANAIVLPYVVTFNAQHATKAYERVKRNLQLEEGVLEWILGLRKALDIPHTLTEAGVDSTLLEALSEQAYADACHMTNPRTCHPDDFTRLYEAAFKG